MVTKPPEDYSVWKEAALVVSLLVNCVNLIGFVSTGWAVPIREHDPHFEGLGLWQFCSHNLEGVVTCVDTKDLGMPSWFQATQAMATLGFTSMVLAFFTIVISECNKKLRENKVAIMVFIGLAFGATFFTLIAVIVFGITVDDEPIDLPGEEPGTYFKVAWSFVCCAASAIAHSISGFFGIIELIYFKTRKRMAQSSMTSRLDQSFSPYTSFPEFPEIPPPNGDLTPIENTNTENISVA